MKSVVVSGIALVLLLGAVGVLDTFNIHITQEASAYDLLGCKWSSSNVNWKAGANLTATNLADVKLATTNINDVGSNVLLTQVSSGEQVDVYQWNHSELTTTRGVTFSTCSGGNFVAPSSVLINDPITNGFPSQKRQATWSHEFGHALGLAHPSGTGVNNDAKNMQPTAVSYDTYGIFFPVLDDIRGLQSLYGSSTSTSECWTFTQSGSVTYTGTCSSSNPALPMTDKVTTAGSGNRAFASDSPTGSSLPSSNTVLTIAKVQPSTLYRFSQGIHTNSNVADTASRYATVELDNDGVRAAWSDAFGLTETSTLWSGTPSTSTTYFLELVAQNAYSEAAYAYKDDGGGSTPPTYLGKASFDTGISSWSGSKFFGTGAWTDSGSNPLSNYIVNEYDNKLK